MKFKYNSLFVKLFITFVILIFLILINFGLCMKYLSPTPFKLRKVFHKNMAYYTSLIVKDIGEPPQIENIKKVKKDSDLDVYIHSADFNYTTDKRLLDYDKEQYHAVKIADDTTLLKNRRFKHKAKFFVKKANNRTYVFSNIFDPDFNFPYTAFIVALIVSCLLIAFAYYYVRCLFKPLDRIKEATDLYAQGKFDHKVQLKTNNQFDNISESINTMALKIKSMLEAKRELLLAIAHEIRTPITTAKLHLEFLESGQTKDAINHELNQMNSLISNIIESEKLNEEHAELVLEECDMNEVITSTLSTYFPQKKIEFNSNEKVNVQIDFLRYQLVLKNILTNALTHGNSVPKIELNKDTLIIRDSGPGVPEDQIQYITEAFYRVDKARVRTQTGGVGLGLYLTSHILNAHNHKLTIYNDNGAVFKINFSL